MTYNRAIVELLDGDDEAASLNVNSLQVSDKDRINVDS